LISDGSRASGARMTEDTSPETGQETGETQQDQASAPDAISNAADVPPDRLAIDPSSPHFDEEKLRRGVGIRFKGVERTNVEEYCISEGWVRVQAGKAMDRRGRPLTIKLSGPVESWYEDLGDNPPVAKKD
jgi:hypothetical protein